MSKQHEWQKRQRALGRCIICGKDAVPLKRNNGPSARCAVHRMYNNILNRERMRKVHGLIGRYQHCESYLYG